VRCAPFSIMRRTDANATKSACLAVINWVLFEERHNNAVNEPDDPLLDAWPFLLIVRTGRIVTAHTQTLQRGCDRQYRRIHGVSSI
jgi:hypothetical protein